MHETLLIPGQTSLTLKSGLDHYSWKSYQHLVDKHTAYAQLSAQDKFAAGKRCSLGYAFFRFGTDFLQQSLLRLGVLDGWRGLLMAAVLGQYAFHKYACLWSMRRTVEEENNT